MDRNCLAGDDAASGQGVDVYVGKPILSGVAAGSVTAGDELIAAASGQVQTLAAASTATSTHVNNSRSVLGVAIDTVTTGQVTRIVPD